MMTMMKTTLMTNEGMWSHKSSVRVNSDTHDINWFSKNDGNRDDTDDDDSDDDDDDDDGDDDDDDNDDVHHARGYIDGIPHASTSTR